MTLLSFLLRVTFGMMLKPKRHLIDIFSTALASLAATGVDGLLYAGLLQWTINWGAYRVGLAAALAAFLGGMTHFILCRIWVFQRYDKPLKHALVAYMLMCGGAALVHGLLTHALSLHVLVSSAWLISKLVVFLMWTYPMSRFVVFGQIREEMN